MRTARCLLAGALLGYAAVLMSEPWAHEEWPEEPERDPEQGAQPDHTPTWPPWRRPREPVGDRPDDVVIGDAQARERGLPPMRIPTDQSRPIRALNGCVGCGGPHYIRRRDLARYCDKCGRIYWRCTIDELLAKAFRAA